MAKLQSLGSRLKPVQQRQLSTANTSDRRMTGSRLQARRYRLWLADPRCAHCGCVVAYPGGFELDHIVSLDQGGADTDANCQILCVRFELVDGQRIKAGCHAVKTAEDTQGGNTWGVGEKSKILVP